MGEAKGLITISKTITDITLPRIAIYRIEQNQTIPTIIDNIGYPLVHEYSVFGWTRVPRLMDLGRSRVPGISVHMLAGSTLLVCVVL